MVWYHSYPLATFTNSTTRYCVELLNSSVEETFKTEKKTHELRRDGAGAR